MIFLPLVVLLLVFGVLGGSTNMVVLLPMALMLGLGAGFVTFVLRDGQKPPDRSVRQLPTDHLRRQMYMALRSGRRAARQRDRNEQSD